MNEKRILKIKRYDEKGINYYIGTPKSESDHQVRGGAIENCIEDIKRHLSNIDNIQFSEEITEKDKSKLKTLLGIN